MLALPYRRGIRLLRLTLVLLVGGVLLALLSSWRAERSRTLTETADRLDRALAPPTQALADLLVRHCRNARFLSQLPAVAGLGRALLQENEIDPHDHSTAQQWRQRLGSSLVAFANDHPNITRVRYQALGTPTAVRVWVERPHHGRPQLVAETDLPQQSLSGPGPSRLAKERVWVSLFSPHQNLRQPSITIAAVAHTPSGVPLGLIELSLGIEGFLRSLEHPLPQKNVQLYLLDSQQNILGMPPGTGPDEASLPHDWRADFRPAAPPSGSALQRYVGPQGPVYSARTRIPLNPSADEPFVELVAVTSKVHADLQLRNAILEDARVIGLAAGITGVLLALYALGFRERLRARGAQDRLATLVNQAGDAIIGLDLDGKVLDWNPAAERLLGYRHAEATGRAIGELLTLSQAPPPASIEAALQAPSPLCCELRCVDPQGDQALILRLTASPLYDSDEQRCGTSLILRDVTAERRQQTALSQLNNQLEQLVAERTASLESARAQAEASNRAKSQFLANMSHEIRTPMNAVVGGLQLLRRSPLPPQQQRVLETAEIAARTLLQILNDILDYSKIEADKLVLNNEPFSLQQMMREVGAVLAANVGSKPVDLVFDMPPNLPSRVIGDRLRMQQILLNLAGNALKFTTEGHVVIRLTTSSLAEGQLSLTFTVLDTGIGMEPAELEHVFEGFAQAEASTTRHYGGTGLGLTISRHLAQRMGGSLEAESTPGQGSCFTFSVSLPLQADGSVRDRLDQLATLHQLHIALVDRPSLPRTVVADSARRFGWTILQVSSQTELPETLDPTQVILVNARVGMGEIDALLVRLANPNLTQPPQLLVLTTLTGQSELLAAIPELATRARLLVKPLTPSQLFDAVADLQLKSPPLPSSPPARPTTGLRLRGLNLLVVDDNRLNQEIAVELLQSEGASVEVAYNGHAALEALRTRPQDRDLVLMDMHMPGMDGLQATRLIRQELGLSSTTLPIIAMTANATLADKQMCLAAGMNDHVGKPFYLDDLVQHILRYTRPHLHGPRGLRHRNRPDQVPSSFPPFGDSSLPPLGASSLPPLPSLPPLRASSLPPFRPSTQPPLSSLPPLGDWSMPPHSSLPPPPRLPRTHSPIPPRAAHLDLPLLADLAEISRRFGDNRGLLKRALDHFGTQHSDFVNDAQEDLLAVRHRELAQKVHSLKGWAGTLGAMRLTHGVSALEEALAARAPTGQLRALIDQLAPIIVETHDALHELATQLAQEAAPAAMEPLSPLSIPALEELAQTLQDHNMHALALHTAMRDQLERTHPELAHELDAALLALDFPRAQRTCMEFKDRLIT